jgi:hypothetical protein
LSKSGAPSPRKIRSPASVRAVSQNGGFPAVIRAELVERDHRGQRFLDRSRIEKLAAVARADDAAVLQADHDHSPVRVRIRTFVDLLVDLRALGDVFGAGRNDERIGQIDIRDGDLEPGRGLDLSIFVPAGFGHLDRIAPAARQNKKKRQKRRSQEIGHKIIRESPI